MASVEGVLSVWMVLESAGLARPWLSEEETDRAASVWAAVLADIPDERLAELAVAWLRSPEGRFGRWPVPGALLGALPDAGQIDDADEAWAEALGLLAWRGRDRCPSSAAELEDLRGRIVAALAKEANPDRRHRLTKALGKLPRADGQRTEALLAGVAACGGWRALGSCEDESALMAHRASFRAVYRAHRQRKTLTESEAKAAALLDGHLRLLPGGRS